MLTPTLTPPAKLVKGSSSGPSGPLVSLGINAITPDTLRLKLLTPSSPSGWGGFCSAPRISPTTPGPLVKPPTESPSAPSWPITPPSMLPTSKLPISRSSCASSPGMSL